MKRFAIPALCLSLTLACLTPPAHAAETDQRPKLDITPFTRVRMDHAAQPDFDPYAKPQEEKDKIFDAYKQHDDARVLALSRKWIQKYPADADIHKVRALACARTNHLEGYFYHMHFYYGLLASITASGNGRTPETAFKVISVEEEYHLLNHIGARRLRQSLIQGHCDRIECEFRDRTVTFYFDISIPISTLQKKLKDKSENKDRQ